MRKRLSEKQLLVLEDLFASDLSEKEVLDKHKISISSYTRWHSNPLFFEEFEKRKTILNRRALLYISKNASGAADELVKLTKSQRPETARKACVDIISLLSENKKKTDSSPPPQAGDKTNHSHISPKLAEKLLAALADEKT